MNYNETANAVGSFCDGTGESNKSCIDVIVATLQAYIERTYQEQNP